MMGNEGLFILFFVGEQEANGKAASMRKISPQISFTFCLAPLGDGWRGWGTAIDQ